MSQPELHAPRGLGPKPTAAFVVLLLLLAAVTAAATVYTWGWRDRADDRTRALAYASAVSFNRSWVLQDVNRLAPFLWRASYQVRAGGTPVCVLIDLKRFATLSGGGPQSYAGVYRVRC